MNINSIGKWNKLRGSVGHCTYYCVWEYYKVIKNYTCTFDTNILSFSPNFILFLGNVCAISLNTQIGVEDCISITNNILQMSLIESSYQNLCLPAKDSSI